MPPISEPSSRIEPEVGRSAPAIRLKIVLLPEPLGPIRPRISPLRSSNETRFTARNPSKLLVRDSTTSTGCPDQIEQRALLHVVAELVPADHGFLSELDGMDARHESL